MKERRIGLDMPMVCIVRKDGTEECGVPIGFRSKMVMPAKAQAEIGRDPALAARYIAKRVQFIVFPFVEVSCDDIAELYTFDEKGDRHGNKVDALIQAYNHI
jgi:hypothetical protein